MKIIIGVDFSDSSENAILHASIWAKKYLAELVLVHTYLPMTVDPNIPVGSIEVLQLEHINELNEKLKIKARLIQETGIKTSFKVVVGDVKYSLLEAIKSENADLLILGKTKNPNFVERLIGSNAQHLVNAMNVPILVIPENARPKEPKVISYATEGEFIEDDVIKAVKSIGDKFKADVKLFTVKTPSVITITEEPDREYISGPTLREGITQYIDKVNSDLLVLVSHKRGLLDGLLVPSKSKMLISKIDTPILIYHFT
jgi:nucleotide-binding universal stress UspA family protein